MASSALAPLPGNSLADFLDGGRDLRPATASSGGPYTYWGPQTIAKLVPITPMSLWFMGLITIVIGANLNQLITRGPHIVHIPTAWWLLKPNPSEKYMSSKPVRQLG